MTGLLAAMRTGGDGLHQVLVRSFLLDALCDLEGRGLLIVRPDATELLRTSGASKHLGKWFPGGSQQQAVPPLLAEHVAIFMAEQGNPSVPWTRVIEGEEESLIVELFRVPEFLFGSSSLCVVSLREQHPPDVPECWRPRLSPRQFKIAAWILRGASNEIIASEIGCTVATVKKQISMIFDRLGVFSRSQVCALAARQR